MTSLIKIESTIKILFNGMTRLAAISSPGHSSRFVSGFIIFAFVIFGASPALSNQAEFYKSAGLKCEVPTSQLSSLDSGRAVGLYIRESFNSFDSDSRMERNLRKLLQKYPQHPVLNWQMGWLNYVSNNFEGAVTSLTTAANQGEPNAAYLMAYIGLGLLDGEDALKPDSSTRLTPIDLEASSKCLEVAVSANPTVVVDGGFYNPWFQEGATELLTALYIHDIENLFGSRAPKPKYVDWSAIPFNPERAQSLAESLPKKQNYAALVKSVEKAVKAEQVKDAERKRQEQLAYQNSLKLNSGEMEALDKKCASYTTIKGVCWALSIDEMRSVLATRGYASRAEEKDYFRGQAYSSIQIKRDSIIFSCGIFNACDLSLTELAGRVKQAGLISGNFEIDNEVSQDLVFKTGISTSTTSLCGRGLNGEKLCIREVTSSLGGAGTVTVELGKGIVGKNISFD